MFSGKSEELLRRLNRLQYADVKFLLFKPKIDTRTKRTVKSRDGRKNKAITIGSAKKIITYLHKHNLDVSVIGVDEAQFFDDGLGDVCELLANEGHIVYVAGLDLDFRGEPFKSMLTVMAYAEKITKLTAICTECGAPATRTQRLINGEPASYHSPLINVGDIEKYTARCRHHHIVKNKPISKYR
jgi:thymidine kinase